MKGSGAWRARWRAAAVAAVLSASAPSVFAGLAAGDPAPAAFPGLAGEPGESLLALDRATREARAGRLTIMDGDTGPVSSVREDTYSDPYADAAGEPVRPDTEDTLARVRSLREQHRATGNPRFLGYAQALLRPWTETGQAGGAMPAELALAYADLLQAGHHFETAGKFVDEVLIRHPRHPQAWLMSAAISLTRGEHDRARSACAHLFTLAAPLISTTCAASVAGATGAGTSAYRLLNDVLAREQQADPAMRGWALAVRADIAARLGHYRAADDDYAAALAATPDNSALRTQYAGFLLERDAPARALEILAERSDNAVYDLLRALAWQALGQEEQLAPLRASLVESFAALRARGDSTHAREEAIFELDIRRAPQRALSLAQTNWAVQREPVDALLLLRAAVAAGDQTARAEILQWIRESGLEDQRLSEMQMAVANR